MSARTSSPTSRRRPPRPAGLRREMMIAAAAELFRKRGFRGTGIEDIGAAVGTSGPAIYRHFASKEAILVELLERAVRRAQRDVMTALAAGLSPTETLREILRRSVAHAVEESDLVAMAAAEGRHLSRETRRRISREQGVILREWVAALRAVRPELSDAEAVATCRGVFALVTSAARAQGLAPPAARALAERMAWAALLAEPREVIAD
jgi:AcrR family transcriptional regulator